MCRSSSSVVLAAVPSPSSAAGREQGCRCQDAVLDGKRETENASTDRLTRVLCLLQDDGGGGAGRGSRGQGAAAAAGCRS